jgi:predicted nucleic acid-binding protein
LWGARSKFPFSDKIVAELRDTLERVAVIVGPTVVSPEACRDVEDLVILGTAAAANAELLITVDRDRLLVGRFAGAEIIKPGAYWERRRDRSHGK